MWARSLRHFGTAVRPRQLKGHFDYRAIADDADAWIDVIARRKHAADVRACVQLYEQFRQLNGEVNALRTKRNELTAQVTALLSNIGAPNTDNRERLRELSEQGKVLKKTIADAEARLGDTSTKLNVEGLRLPNKLHPDVPRDRPRVVQTVGAKPPDDIGFPILDHVALGERHGMFDFESAAKISGSSFYFLTGAAALLEIALIQFAMSRCASRGFLPVTTPDIVHRDIAEGCGYQPRGEASQMYGIERGAAEAKDSPALSLIGTAEIPLAGMYANHIFAASSLPLRMVAFSHCFRREVGSYGAENRGLYRVHQFSKVEMFAFARPHDSDVMLDELVELQKQMFADLGLHFVVLDMPADDLGASAYRKYDIEAYMPGRGSYGEISSASNCTEYQSRRLNIRYRAQTGTSAEFLHTINGTALAIPRIIIALMETHQRPDGSIVLPEALHPYLGALPRVLKPMR